MSDSDILAETERFIAHHHIPPTTFGRRAIGDANLVEDLRAGRELRRATEAKVRDFMVSYADELRSGQTAERIGPGQ